MDKVVLVFAAGFLVVRETRTTVGERRTTAGERRTTEPERRTTEGESRTIAGALVRVPRTSIISKLLTHQREMLIFFSTLIPHKPLLLILK